MRGHPLYHSHDVLFVHVFQDVCPYHSMQIRLHVLEDAVAGTANDQRNTRVIM